MKGWGYWDYVNAGQDVPQPFDENWADFCEAKQAGAARYIAAKPRRHTSQPESVTCAICGKPLEGKRSHSRTCSPKCRKALSRRK